MNPTDVSPARAADVRVLIVAKTTLDERHSDGIANFVRAFVRCMPDDFEVAICGVADDASGETGWQTRTFAGRQVRYLPVPRFPRRGSRLAKARAVLGILRARRQLATKGRILQVHAPGLDLGLVGHHSPLLRVVHPDLTAARGDGGSPGTGIGLRLMERFTFRRAARIYFVNRATYELYATRAGSRPDRLRYLPLFVDASVFYPLAATERVAAREELAGELGLRANAPWVLFAGRLVSRKKPMLALQALAAAPAGSALEKAQLLFVGDGALLADLEHAASEAGISERVRFLGILAQNRLAKLMQAADSFLLTAAWEGGPTVVYEALAAGLPVVSTPVGDVPHLVTQNSTGWVVGWGPDESVAAALAAGLEWTLGEDRQAIAERCAASMELFHTERALAPFYEDHRVVADRR